MLKLAMLLNNPGEPLPETQYGDPKHLADLGYNGLVVWETTSLSGVDKPENAGSGEMRRWVEQQFDITRQRIERAQAAGLDVYITYDALTLASQVVQREGDTLLCKNRGNTLCPANDRTVKLSVEALESLVALLPPVSGVILRFGDTDARRYPYLVGNDIFHPHCPRCSHLGRADRVVRIVEAFHELVVKKLDKRLIVRAWNVRPNGMHDSPDLTRRVAERLPGSPDDDRLVLSFKFTETDFWRYQAWNPASLSVGRRPIIYELQCQREFEGKGAIPNWQLPLWRDGYPESPDKGDGQGFAHAVSTANVAGLWAWVRGGGWGGPFIQNETWVDANVYAVPRLADDPTIDPMVIARQWVIDRLKIEDPAIVDAITNVLAASPEFVLEGFYVGPFAKRRPNAWHPNGDLITDDLIDAHAAWTIVNMLPEDQLQAVVDEKHQATEHLANARATLQHLATGKYESRLDPLVNSMLFGESLFEAMRDFMEGLVAWKRWQRSKSKEHAEFARSRMLAAQSHWQHHTQRHASLKGAATAFREQNFWELTQKVLSQVDA